MKRILLLDMDACIANLEGPWLDAYNRDYNDNLTPDKITDWEIQDFVKPECGAKIFDYLSVPGFYESLPVIPGSQDAVAYIDRLTDRAGHQAYEIFVVTSGTNHPCIPSQKVTWMAKHFPWIDAKHIITCYHKELVKGDVLIDDSPKNAKKYRRAWPDAKILSIAYPYNEKAKKYYDLLAESYCNKQMAWVEIAQYLTRLANEETVNG